MDGEAVLRHVVQRARSVVLVLLALSPDQLVPGGLDHPPDEHEANLLAGLDT